MLRLYYISDRSLTPSFPPAYPILEALRAGVDMVQVREKDLAAREILRISLDVTAEAAKRGSEVYINSRFDIARAARAAGVHLPAEGLPPADVRQAAGGFWKIGVSTHSLDQALAAEAGGADFITFGPVFETPSKRRFGPPLGLRALRAAIAAVQIPVYALGGIQLGNLADVLELPVGGIGMVSALALAPDRVSVVHKIRSVARQVRGGDE